MRRIMTILAVVAAMAAIASCDKYDDGRPDRDVINEFNGMYPDARDIEWEFNGTFWEVDFETGPRPNGIDHTAYYDIHGGWMQTRTEVLLNAVPQKIKDYLADSEYGNYQIEDYSVDYYQSPSGNFYRFDIRINGDDAEVDVSEEGKVTLADYGF